MQLSRTPRTYAALIYAVLLIGGAVGCLAQTPTPRPLSPEFLKRREAGSAFELGGYFLRQGKPGSLDTAATKFRESELKYLEIGDRANAACSRLALGAAQAENGEDSSAAITFAEAVASLRDTKDPDKGSLNKLGILYDLLVDKRLLFNYSDLSVPRPKRGYDLNGDRIDTRYSQLSEQETVQFLNQPIIVRIEPEPESALDDPRFAGSDRDPEPVSFNREALAIWRRNGIESIEVATRLRLMDAWADSDPQIAVLFGKQAINQYQQMRRLLQNDRPYDPRIYVNRLSEKYRTLADLLIGLGRFAEADDVLQMLKEEEFSQFVTRDPTEMATLKRRVRLTRSETASIDRYLALATRASSVSERYSALEDKKRKDALPAAEEQERLKLAQDIADINAAFKLFLDKEMVNEIGRYNADYIGADKALMTAMRGGSDRSTALLYTVVSENRYRVVLTTANIQIDAKSDVPAAVLNKKIQAFRNALQDTSIDPRPLGKELYDILVKPIENQLTQSGVTKLVWSLDGALRYIPFAALSPDGKTYLAERFQTVILTNRARELALLPANEWRAIGLGVSVEQTVTYPHDPDHKVKIVALPGAKDELEAVIRDENNPQEKGIISGRRFLNDDFTMKNLIDSLAVRLPGGEQKYNVVHIASHFDLGGNWSESYLYLGGGKVLSLKELSRSREISFANVDLITLSACKTALLTTADGYEVESLAETIQSKGGKTVLATLWNINDESSAELMKDFYKLKVASPATAKPAALQKAQIELIRGEKFSHPYFWAGYVLIGSWK